MKSKVAEEKMTAWKRWKAKRYFSARGGLTMALRRSISGVAATSLGLATEVDVHHVTVTKYELRLRAAQVSAMQAFSL